MFIEKKKFQGKFQKYIFIRNYILIGSFLINIFVSGLTSVSYANILFEPFLGYSFKGQVKQKLDANGITYENESVGLGYGIRLGYIGYGFMLGLQGDVINEDWSGKDPKTIDVNDKKQTIEGKNIGLFVGYQTPFMLRIWSSYYFYDEYKKKDDNGPYSKDDAYIGNAFSFGCGLRLLRFLALNAEYRKFTFDRLFLKSDNKTYKLDNGRNVNKSEIYLSLSFPFIF